MAFGQRTFLRQVLMKVWTLLIMFTFILQVSAPYRGTDFISFEEDNKKILV